MFQDIPHRYHIKTVFPEYRTRKWRRNDLQSPCLACKIRRSWDGFKPGDRPVRRKGEFMDELPGCTANIQ